MHEKKTDEKILSKGTVITAVILRNISPITAVEGITPYECFIGSKPNVSNIKVSGYAAYLQIPEETSKKWCEELKYLLRISHEENCEL